MASDEHWIGGRGVAQLLKARGQLQRVGSEERELLLQADGEVGRGVKGRASGVEIGRHGRSPGHVR